MEPASPLTQAAAELEHLLGEVEGLTNAIEGGDEQAGVLLDEFAEQLAGDVFAATALPDTLRAYEARRIDGDVVFEEIEYVVDSLEQSLDEVTFVQDAPRVVLTRVMEILRAALPRIDVAAKGRRDWCVYLHRDPAGRVFYVGMGIGRRPWSKQRTMIWEQYVERIGGEYSVEIVADELLEDEASVLESRLIAEHGAHLTNTVNPAREMDYATLSRFHALRDANRALMRETRALEKSDPSEAVVRYRRAMTAMHEYASMTLETGFFADVVAELNARPTHDEPVILDRLTLTLKQLGRHAELISEVEEYMLRYPSAATTSLGQAAVRRAEAAARGRQ